MIGAHTAKRTGMLCGSANKCILIVISTHLPYIINALSFSRIRTMTFGTGFLQYAAGWMFDVNHDLTLIGRFRHAFFLCFKTSPGAQPFIWKYV